MQALRWLLVIPAGFFGWTVGLGIALLGYTIADRLCPPALVVSGMCTAAWFPIAESASLALGSIVCGALVVLLPSRVAPAHRGAVARIAYAVGLVCSAVWAANGLWVPVAWAALGGALMLWRLTARDPAAR